MATKTVLFAAFLLLFSAVSHSAPFPLSPPKEGHIQVMNMRDGSSIVGKIIGVEGDNVKFETANGIFMIPVANIIGLKEIPATDVRRGEVWLPDQNQTRLFFSPTGKMLDKGEGYFAAYYLFFPSVNYGFTDKLSFGGGMSLFPGVSLNKQIFFFTPKFRLYQKDKLSTAAGALVIRIPWLDDGDDDFESNGNNTNESATLSLLYGVATWGGDKRDITVALGYGMVDTNLADKPMLVIGARHRLTRRTAFVTENWIIPEASSPLVSYGIRFLGERLSVDMAFFTPIGKDWIFPGIPWIDFVWNFGGK